jgi:hypothetical protein
MTPIESIYEIKKAVLDLKKYLLSKDTVVSRRAQIKYEQWVDRFFREHEIFLASQQRHDSLHNLDYFMSLIESAKKHYDPGV